MFYMDLKNYYELLYAILFLLALVFFILGACLSLRNLRVSSLSRSFFSKSIERDHVYSLRVFYFVTAVAVFVTYFYYHKVGYNLLIDLILGREILDFVSARLAMYSGENYYAPGYANQFKNALLPLCVGVLIYSVSTSGKFRVKYLWLLVLTSVMLWSLLGTGQRGPFLYSIVAIIFSVSLIRKLPLMRILVIVVGVVLIFGTFSVLNLRTEDTSLIGAVAQILMRIFKVEQIDGIESFKYVASIESSYLYEWLQGFLGISPWHSGSYLEHETFYRQHGTDRGTSAVSLVAGAYHNGRMLLVALFYFALGYLYSSIYIRFLSGRKTILRCFGYGHIFFICSVFVGGAPIFLINKGLIMFALILVIRKIRFPLGARYKSLTI